jgi:hypothetical protein
VAALRSCWRAGSTWESWRVLVSAPIAIRQSATSADHSDIGEIHSSWASEAPAKYAAACPSKVSATTGWARAASTSS